MGNIEVAGVQTAQETLQQFSVVDAVFLGVNQADTIVNIISQRLVEI